MALTDKLTAIGDAIRAQTGKTELLTLDQMATEIDGIQTVAEFNFEVVGGTTAPTNPIDNTFWINTDTTITEWVFNLTAPSEPKSGMVWFQTDVSSDFEFDAIQDNGIYVYPKSAKQYINNAWVGKSVSVYQNGTWKNWAKHLYINGDECADVTGGWSYNSGNYSTMGSIARNPTSLGCYSSSGRSANFYTKNKVSFAGYDTLRVNVKSAWIGSTSYNWIIINTYPNHGYQVAMKANFNATNQIITFDISSLNDSYHVYIGCASDGAESYIEFSEVTLL